MAGSLLRLLEAPAASHEDAWAAFPVEYSDLIRFAIRKTENDADAVGDAYVYVLEHLRRDDFRRLRAFDVEGPARFTTWLVVVVRRLAIDLRRKRSGRNPPPDDPETPDPRRQLEERASAANGSPLLGAVRNPDAGLSAFLPSCRWPAPRVSWLRT